MNLLQQLAAYLRDEFNKIYNGTKAVYNSIRLGGKTLTQIETDRTNAIDSAIQTNVTDQKGAANGLATLDGNGNIDSGQLPDITITDTFEAANEAAMLALVAQTGDIAIRADVNKTYILQGSDPTVLANWRELPAPTDGGYVTSFNGRTGVVVLQNADVTDLIGTYLEFTTVFETGLLAGAS